MGANPFVTPIEHARLHPAGWLRLATGVHISRLALIDDRYTERFARLPHSAPLPNGWRLPTLHSLVELKAHALVIKPYTLPTVAMLEAAGVPKPWQNAQGNDTPAMRVYRTAYIRSEDWCAQHDAEVWRRLRAAGWNGEPVFNDGKHWGLGGAIYGWDAIQPWSTFHAHDVTYTDYATTVHVECDSPDAGDVIDKAPIPTLLGARGPAVLAWQRWLNTHGYRDAEDKPLVEDGIHGQRTEYATAAWREATPREEVPTTPEPLDLARIPYRAARVQSPGWPYGPPLGVCIHTSQNTEHPMGAEVLQSTASRNDAVVSWHYSVDNDSITQSVALANRAAAAVPGNDRWIHIELFGRAEQSRDEWRDAYSTSQLRLAARLVASLCRLFRAPVRHISVADVLAGDVPGICGHADISRASLEARNAGVKRMPWWTGSAWRYTNHYDPGPNFPWDEFIAMVSQS